jgi:hypothetical protein
MYTDQVMDNLIRASENMPFVQLAYRNLTVTDLQTVKASLGDESDPTKMKTVAELTAALLQSVHGYTNKLFYNGGFERDRQMQFQADPVVGKADVYEYYMAFAKDPALFWISGAKPDCDVHIKKECSGKWYWVPKEASGVFLQLVLKTTFMRGPETPPPVYWYTSVIAISPRYTQNGVLVPDKYLFTFSNEVPNDDGVLTVNLDNGKQVRIPLERREEEPHVSDVVGQERVAGPPPGRMVNALYAQYPKKADGPSLDDITNRPSAFDANDWPNLGSKTPELQRLEEAVANYRRSVTVHP